MREEDKIITIFNKNGITISKYIDRSKGEDSSPYAIYLTYETPSGYVKPLYSSNSKEVKVKKVSPLGFYYYKTEIQHDDVSIKDGYLSNLSKKIINVIIKHIDDNYTYKISYLTSYHGTSINKETRPWDLIGGNFPDNYMWGLLKNVNDIFTELSSYKNAKAYITHSIYDDKQDIITIQEMRRKIINDLFGDPDGPKFQTNDEKILAHGFDLKTSFRKM